MRVQHILRRHTWATARHELAITIPDDIYNGLAAHERHAALRGQVVRVRADPYALEARGLEFAEHLRQQRGIEPSPAIFRQCATIPDIGCSWLESDVQPKLADLFMIEGDPAIGDQPAINPGDVAARACE